MHNPYEDFFKEVKRFIIELAIEDENRVQGCTDEEIESIEIQYGVLPLAYKTYLTSIGKNFLFHFFDGEQFSYSDFEDIQSFVNRTLTGVNFKSDRLFFPISHYRYEYFQLFYLKENDNPEIWFFEEFPDEGKEHIEISSTSFTDIIISYFKRTLHQHHFGFHFVSEEEKDNNENVIEDRYLKWFKSLVANHEYIGGFRSDNEFIAKLHGVFQEYFLENEQTIFKELIAHNCPEDYDESTTSSNQQMVKTILKTKMPKPWWKFWL